MKFKTEYLFGLIPIGFYLLNKKPDLLKIGGNLVSGSYKKVLFYRKITKLYSSIYGVPNEILLSIIATESMGVNHTNSGSSGEIGICQITPVGLQYTDTNYTIEQMKNTTKCIEVASIHLYKDYNLFSDWNYTIMAYNINRKHIINVLDGTATQENKNMVGRAGRTYLGKVTNHKKVIMPMLLNPSIEDEKHKDFIPFETL